MSTSTDQPQTSGAPDEPLDFSGPIAPETVPSLIHSICSSRETGVLILREGKIEDFYPSTHVPIEKSAYVQEGRLVFARSNDPDDRLGEVLLRTGVLSIRGFERCTDEVARTGRRLGGLLVEEGLISAKDLVEGVQEQVREILYSLFLWTRGEYSFGLGPLPTKEVITLRVNTFEIIRTGLQRIRTWSRIRQAVGSLDTRYRTVPGYEERLKVSLSPLEERLLQFCASPSSVGEICDTLPGNHFELCRLIWAFMVVGVLWRS